MNTGVAQRPGHSTCCKLHSDLIMYPACILVSIVATCMLREPARSLPVHSVWPRPQDSGRDAALDSLSAIVRGMASGHVRRYLEAQEAHWEVTCGAAVTICS